MEIIKIQEAELMQARELQKHCVDLHLPSPPVISWIATIVNEEGKEIQQTIAKANSYVRNAYNALARFVGLCATDIINNSVYGDGSINNRQTNGVISYLQANGLVSLGLGDNINPVPENINHYSHIVNTGSWSINPAVNGQIQRVSDFDSISRKLITQISITYVNLSSNNQFITEACVYYGQINPHTVGTGFLMIRDVFAPINVPSGMSIRFTYQTEVLFPL